MDSIKQKVLEYLNNQKLSYTESLDQKNYNAYKTNLQSIIKDINNNINNTGYNLSANFTNICSSVANSFGSNVSNPKIVTLVLQNNKDSNDYVTISIEFVSFFTISTPTYGGANKKSKRMTKRTKRKHTRKYRMK